MKHYYTAQAQYKNSQSHTSLIQLIFTKITTIVVLLLHFHYLFFFDHTWHINVICDKKQLVSNGSV